MLFYCQVGRSSSSRPFVEDCRWIGPDGRYWEGNLHVKVSGGGARWPEVLDPAASDVPPLLREDLCHQWMKPGFTGMKFKPVQILEVRSRRLRDVAAPRYWSLSVTGKVVWRHMAYALRGDSWEMIDGRLLSEDERQNYKPGLWSRMMRHRDAEVAFRRIPVPGAWDGSDFFNPPKPPFAYSFYCTRRVVDTVRQAGLESFGFAPLDSIGFPEMPKLKAMPWPPGPASYGNGIKGGPPLCAEYESGKCPVPSVMEVALSEGFDSGEGADLDTGAFFFGQPVSFCCDYPEAATEFSEFMTSVRRGLPAVLKGAEAYFLKHVCKGRRPEIWVADILLEEGETSLERWTMQVEGDAGEDGEVQSWNLTIEQGTVVEIVGGD